MSLTQDDLRQIRTIVREVVSDEVSTVFQTEGRKIVREEIDKSISTLDGRLMALENDVKEIYKMISELQKLTRKVAHFEKYNLEQKIVTAYKDILSIANEASVELSGK